MGFVANNISSSRYSIERKYHLSSDFENFWFYLFYLNGICFFSVVVVIASFRNQVGATMMGLSPLTRRAAKIMGAKRTGLCVRIRFYVISLSVTFGDLSVRQSDSSVNKLENFYRFLHIPSDRYDHHNI